LHPRAARIKFGVVVRDTIDPARKNEQGGDRSYRDRTTTHRKQARVGLDAGRIAEAFTWENPTDHGRRTLGATFGLGLLNRRRCFPSPSIAETPRMHRGDPCGFRASTLVPRLGTRTAGIATIPQAV
jgi:hypothetical protein